MRTTEGELIWLGRPVDGTAATALCAALEDELELLPPAPAPMRVDAGEGGRPREEEALAETRAAAAAERQELEPSA